MLQILSKDFVAYFPASSENCPEVVNLDMIQEMIFKGYYRGWFRELIIQFIKYQKKRWKIDQKARGSAKFHVAACFKSILMFFIPKFQKTKNKQRHYLLDKVKINYF